MPGIVLGITAMGFGFRFADDHDAFTRHFAIFVIVLGVITFLVGLDSRRERS